MPVVRPRKRRNKSAGRSLECRGRGPFRLAGFSRGRSHRKPGRTFYCRGFLPDPPTAGGARAPSSPKACSCVCAVLPWTNSAQSDLTKRGATSAKQRHHRRDRMRICGGAKVMAPQSDQRTASKWSSRTAACEMLPSSRRAASAAAAAVDRTATRAACSIHGSRIPFSRSRTPWSTCASSRACRGRSSRAST